MAKKTSKRSKAPKGPSTALLNMMPPGLRQELKQLEADRDDENVTPLQWEAKAMNLMHKANTLPPVLRDGFGKIIKQLSAVEQHEDKDLLKKIKEEAKEEKASKKANA